MHSLRICAGKITPLKLGEQKLIKLKWYNVNFIARTLKLIQLINNVIGVIEKNHGPGS